MASPFEIAIRDKIWREQMEIRQQSFPRPADSPDSSQFAESRRRIPLVEFFASVFGGKPKQNEPFQPWDPADYGKTAVGKFNALPPAARIQHMLQFPEDYAGFSRDEKRAIMGLGPSYNTEALEFGQEGASYEGGKKKPKPQPQDPSTFIKPTPTPPFPEPPAPKPFSNPVGREGAGSYGAEAAAGRSRRPYTAPSAEVLAPVQRPPDAALMPRAAAGPLMPRAAAVPAATGYIEPATPFSSGVPIAEMGSDQLLSEYTRLKDPTQYRPGTAATKRAMEIERYFGGDEAAYDASHDIGSRMGSAAKPQTYRMPDGTTRVVDDLTSIKGKRENAAIIASNGEPIGQLGREESGDPGSFGNRPTPSMTTNIQKEILETGGTIALLRSLEESTQSEFLTLGGRARGRLGNLWDTLSPSTVPESERQYLYDINSWAATSYTALNKYIHDITGAQLSQFEADRIRRAFPDPGDDVFMIGGPTPYRAKLAGVLLELNRANARRRYVLGAGITEKGTGDHAYGIPLTNIVGIMESYADDVQDGIMAENPGIATPDLIAQTELAVIDKFGVGIADVIGE